MDDAVGRVAEAVAEALSDGELLVASTGAGMSRESGIPTFRGEEGIWREYRAEVVATPTAFRDNPQLFWEFNDHLRELVSCAEPNAAHLALAQLEQFLEPARQFHLITQNVDRLHERAGSRKVLHLHGDIVRVYCPRCGANHEEYPVPAPMHPPVCDCGHFLRPDIVLFGEALPQEELEQAFQLAEDCRVMLVVGTSGNVMPAASLPLVARDHGALVVEVNPEDTPLTRVAQYALRGTAVQLLPPLCVGIAAARPES